MSVVDLGFLEECEPWQVESRLFPSKVGGKPAWLSISSLPSSEDLLCVKCKQPLIFLCQVYAPIEEDDSNFHRTTYVFMCRNGECCERNNSNNIKVFRSTLPRRNTFYSYDPPVEQPDPTFSLSKWVKLCNVCGCLAEKHCSQCKKTAYCSRDHQVSDWKNGHKGVCVTGNETKYISRKLFPEWELVTEPEELEKKEVNVQEELEKLKLLMVEGKIGTMNDVTEEDLETHASKDDDKVFTRFRKIVDKNPDQVLRYNKGGKPLWIAETPTPDEIPNCENCGSERQFEFQIMPQMLSMLKENDLDWGVLAIYTCKQSCVESNSYKREFVFKQDVTLKDI